ncbi:MAG: alpha-amylase family glycosyl hydrolase, partial [Kiritimatiellae bacterium]|nr:alpha-amylase family glycosyl hydrolase [Kiritimatiellia bacterium]
MSTFVQHPAPGARLLARAGDVLEVTLQTPSGRAGCAMLRTNLGRSAIRLGEIVAHTETQRPMLAADWHDIPMSLTGEGLYRVRVPLLDPGWFAAKACFIARGSSTPEWPEGDNLTIKVEPAFTVCANTIYTAFVRQFGDGGREPRGRAAAATLKRLDGAGYAVIPPSGTFRNLIRQLDHIVGTLGCRLLQLLPIHPVPTTFARMGRYGSPFAGLDFFAVDPALAEFDRRATPLDQLLELVDAVHARGARLLLDIPANHTGWASTLQTHHPDWFLRQQDGRAFRSPGAWGTTWEDLVELDYRHPQLRAYMAEVFLFWCRQGVDGFRCDAGYMIPAATWTYIVARVRQEYPDTIFMLEGLGGKIEVTERLLTEANMDWAYSEIFQIEDRATLERELPGINALSESAGPLVHFAETHDNNRLAARGENFARMRTALTALLSHAGAFGITNGVEWLAAAKLDVHGATPLNWGARRNQVRAVTRLNTLLATHPAFAAGAHLRLLTQGEGPTLAVRRDHAAPGAGDQSLLVLVNLDAHHAHTVQWPAANFHPPRTWDLLLDADVPLVATHGHVRLELPPGGVCCLTGNAADRQRLREALRHPAREPDATRRQRRNLLALRVRQWLGGDFAIPGDCDPNALGDSLADDPYAFCVADGMPRAVTWNWPEDQRRTVMLPPGFLLLVRAEAPFRAHLAQDGRTVASGVSIETAGGRGHIALLRAEPSMTGSDKATRPLTLHMHVFAAKGTSRTQAPLLALAAGEHARAVLRVSGDALRADGHYALLTNGRGAMAQVRAAWGTVRSQYDALLAVNPHPRVPENRRVFFTRCRAWVVHCGYSHALE